MNFSKAIYLYGIAFLLFNSCKKDDFSQNKSFKNVNSSHVKSNTKFPLVVANSNKSITVINPNTGATLCYNVWDEVQTLKNSLTQAPLFTDSLIINFRGNSVEAIRIKDSSIKWFTTIAEVNKYEYNYTSYPCVNDSLVMFAFSNLNKEDVNGIYALNLNTGKIAWINKNFSIGRYSTPAYSNNILVVNGMNRSGTGHLFAINTKTGKLIWKQKDLVINYPVCIDSNKVYCAVGGYPTAIIDSCFALNLLTGSVIWRKGIDWISDYCQPLISGNHLYISLKDSLLCINKHTGNTIWSFYQYSLGFCAPYAADGKVFVNTVSYNNSYLYAINEATGKPTWKAQVMFPGFGSRGGVEGPVAMNKKIYLRDNGMRIQAFDASNGNLLFTTMLNNYQNTSPEYSPTYVDNEGKMIYSTASGMH